MLQIFYVYRCFYMEDYVVKISVNGNQTATQHVELQL